MNKREKTRGDISTLDSDVLYLSCAKTSWVYSMYRSRDPCGHNQVSSLEGTVWNSLRKDCCSSCLNCSLCVSQLFRLEILFNGRKHFVLRRQSDFHTLHRKLKKILQSPPEFPSKRTQLRAKPQEQRRQELEDYIQVG